jgi:xanthine dehydrogenase accessory factor
MKEAATILQGFDQLAGEGKAAALATVVHVAGSSYRRPGARMLVAADGRTWGGVSGGCLERDVVRRARNLIGSGATILHRYDTTDDDAEFGAAPGVALGCQGLIDIFIEPVSLASPGPIPALRRATIERKPTTLATVIRSTGEAPPPASRIFQSSDVDRRWPSLVYEDLRSAAQSSVRQYSLPGGGAVDVFIECLSPPQSLVLFGGGPDVVPVIHIARTLGWHVTVIASHGLTGAAERFVAADRLLIATDEDPLAGLTPEVGAAIVLMTHNYPRDLQLLPRLLGLPLNYLGILGPRRRAERLVLECHNTPADALGQIYAPVGLDLGAETPESIALAICSEIQAVLARRSPGSLRDRSGPIYPRRGDEPDASAPYNRPACPLSA